jgi:hypothetical protein
MADLEHRLTVDEVRCLRAHDSVDLRVERRLAADLASCCGEFVRECLLHAYEIKPVMEYCGRGRTWSASNVSSRNENTRFAR